MLQKSKNLIDKVPLSPLDIAAIEQLHRCRFFPGSFPKRFARSLFAQADAGNLLVSRKQLYWLWELCFRFRRQIGGEVKEEVIRRRTKPKDFRQPTLF